MLHDLALLCAGSLAGIALLIIVAALSVSGQASRREEEEK